MNPLRLPPFRSHLLLRGGHLQTIAGSYLAPTSQPSHTPRRHEVSLSDGDRLVVWEDPAERGESAHCQVAVLVHGMCGSAESPYVKRIASKLTKQGVCVFRVNLRGCGAGQGLAKNLYHAGRSDDLETVVRQVRERFPDRGILLCGFSLGGNIVMKWLGEQSQRARELINRAIAVNPPLDLHACTDQIEKCLFGFYDRYFARLLSRQIRTGYEHSSPKEALSAKRIIEFDDRFTAPRSGFRNAAHYYAESSAARVTDQIRVPTLVISAADDPLIPARLFSQISFSESVQVHIAESGGHLGYIGSESVDADRQWLDWRVLDWLQHDVDGP